MILSNVGPHECEREYIIFKIQMICHRTLFGTKTCDCFFSELCYFKSTFHSQSMQVGENWIK